MAAVLHVGPGAIVRHEGRVLCVKRFDSADAVVARDIETGVDRRIRLSGLSSSSLRDQAAERPDLVELSDEKWKLACDHYKAIEPLLGSVRRTSKMVKAAARKAKVGPATIYRWIGRFEETGVVSALVRKRRRDAGEKRVDPRSEKTMADVIAERFLDSQKLDVTRAYNEVKSICRKKQFPIPHLNTFKARVKEIAPELAARRRQGRNAALKLRPLRGSLPGADYPYALLQIDHTRGDVVLVDEVHRLPIGRPWITVAIDVYDRLVAGWYVSFDPPGSLGTGMCIANAILPKEPFIASLGVDYPWPCQGRPAVIHLDNAGEFRGETLSGACQEWAIGLKFRKIAKPNYGGHIERFLGTLLKEMHALPGTTFSNPKARENYDSDKKSAMTLKEFEQWLANLILGKYHFREHSALGAGVSPLKHYQDAILGSGDRPGVGTLPVVTDEEKLRIDFLPFERRTVQPYGIQLDGIYYYADVLQRWIGARDSKSTRAKRKFIVRRDPRDISYVLFYDPDARRHFRVPYRDLKRPPMSLWELRAVQRRLAKEGRKNADEETIFKAFDKMLEIEENAKTLTRKTRMNQERRRHHRAAAPMLPPESAETPAVEPEAPYDPASIRPFEEIEEM